VAREVIKIDKGSHGKVEVYVDSENAAEILQYVFESKVDNEFKEIRSLLKENLRNREKYCKVDVSNKAKDMFEMRFTRQRNDRIYCKEVNDSKSRRIIMIELYRSKKSQNIPKKIKSRIEKMGSYEYKF